MSSLCSGYHNMEKKMKILLIIDIIEVKITTYKTNYNDIQNGSYVMSYYGILYLIKHILIFEFVS
jgi:hypothetical protein